MTVEQYEKGMQIFQEISGLKRLIERIQEDESQVRLILPDAWHWGSEKVQNDFTTYADINRAAIRAELLDMLKDHLVKLEDQLKEI